MPIDAKAKDIAWQLVHQDPGNKINVMLGEYNTVFLKSD
jgi:hypothetical protein